MVSRALLAFRGTYERHPLDERFPSDDAELGSQMRGQYEQAVLDIRDWLYGYSEAAKARAEEAARVARLNSG